MRQRLQRRKAKVIVEGFNSAETRAEMKTKAGDKGDEVHVLVEGIKEPIRLLPRTGGILFPTEMDPIAVYWIGIDLACSKLR